MSSPDQLQHVQRSLEEALRVLHTLAPSSPAGLALSPSGSPQLGSRGTPHPPLPHRDEDARVAVLERKVKKLKRDLDLCHQLYEAKLRSLYAELASASSARKLSMSGLALPLCCEDASRPSSPSPPPTPVPAPAARSLKAEFELKLLAPPDHKLVYETPPNREIRTTVVSKNFVRLTWMEQPTTILIIKKPDEPTVHQAFVELATWLHTTKQFDPPISVLVEPPVYRMEGVRDELPFIQTWDADTESWTLQDRVDLVVCLGGDGTLLWASNLFRGAVPPVLSFALGSLGFLTPHRFESFRQTLTRVINKGCTLTLRSRLECQIVKNGSAHHSWSDQLGTQIRAHDQEHDDAVSDAEDDDGAQVTAAVEATTASAASTPALESDTSTNSSPYRYMALNEVVVDRGPYSSITKLDCYCDDKIFSKVLGDGAIISSPTGSTAYSLSAGGPMLHPQVPGFVFTPVCPHSLSFRPLVFPDSCTLKIAVSEDCRSDCMVAFDGKHPHRLSQNDYVEVRVSPHPVPCICLTDETVDWFTGVFKVSQRGWI